jgi:hypothetical protein
LKRNLKLLNSKRTILKMEKIKLGSPGILVIFLFNFTWELLFQVNEVNLSIYQNKFTKQAKTYLSFSNVQVSSVFFTRMIVLDLISFWWVRRSEVSESS